MVKITSLDDTNQDAYDALLSGAYDEGGIGASVPPSESESDAQDWSDDSGAHSDSDAPRITGDNGAVVLLSQAHNRCDEDSDDGSDSDISLPDLPELEFEASSLQLEPPNFASFDDGIPVPDPQDFLECLENLAGFEAAEISVTYIKTAELKASRWSDPYKVSLSKKVDGSDLIDFQDSEKVYFIKFAPREGYHHGVEMLRGEFASMTTIDHLKQGFCPRPLAYGYIAGDTPEDLLPSSWLGSNTDLYGTDAYFICEYVDIECRLGDKDGMGGIPDGDVRKNAIMKEFCKSLVDLHTREPPIPVTKFGFKVKTYNGLVFQSVLDRSLCWSSFFGNNLKDLVVGSLKIVKFQLQAAKELSANTEELIKQTTDAWKQLVTLGVIQKLLGNLKDPKGNPIKPSLIHGDLWCGNTALLKTQDGDNGEPKTVIFDACCFYGHNEYELGNWLPKRNNLNKYIETYLKAYGGRCQPAEEFDRRLQLYSIKFNLNAAILFPKEEQYLKMVIQDMNELSNWAKDKKSQRTSEANMLLGIRN
ncbi:hypothetical protein BJ508DRAFT_326317 [Ascobolus immersus RN42]|uniref:protein-ribulosamine 3-kinase n=1 Tax=Ascobolus immersus RN42 TaxID=1160509 RepID=A0A3N4IBP6_ASCIM|nr:hypothetical protein BJ508DRAFT_326317 [Ascobolus immersus RN42]